jgi:hypothetical protein
MKPSSDIQRRDHAITRSSASTHATSTRVLELAPRVALTRAPLCTAER